MTCISLEQSVFMTAARTQEAVMAGICICKTASKTLSFSGTLAFLQYQEYIFYFFKLVFSSISIHTWVNLKNTRVPFFFHFVVRIIFRSLKKHSLLYSGERSSRCSTIHYTVLVITTVKLIVAAIYFHTKKPELKSSCGTFCEVVCIHEKICRKTYYLRLLSGFFLACFNPPQGVFLWNSTPVMDI